MSSPTGQVEKGLNLRTICDALGRVKTQWFEIGIQLGIPRSKLLEFEEKRDPLSAVVDYWLNENVTDPAVPVSWKTIAEALKSDYVGEPGLAETISKNYGSQNQTASTENTTDSEVSTKADGSINRDQDTTKASQNTTKTDQDTTKTSQNVKSDQDSTKVEGNDEDENRSAASSDSSSLNPDVELDLEQQLDLNDRQIQKQFAFYVTSVQAIVEEKGVSAKSLSIFLLSLPASTPDSEKKLQLMADLKAELKSAEEVVDIFFILSSKYASYLNPDIYVSILEKYGSKEEKKEQNYPEHLKDFVKQHTIKEFAKMYPQLDNPKLRKLNDNSKMIRIKLNISRTQSLNTLDEITGAVANVLGLRASTLRLYGVKKGCVLVVLLIPTTIANTLFTKDTVFSPEQKHGFRAASVLWLECNGHKFDFKDKEDCKETPSQPGSVENVRKQLMETYDGLDKLESVQATPLHSAVESCDTDNVRNLLKGPEVKLQTSTVKPKPTKALLPKLLEKLTGGFEGSNMLRRLGILKRVVRNLYVDARKFETISATPLHRATESHDVGKVREVLGQAEYSVNSTDSVGWTPLHYASAVGNLDMVRMLISEFKADVTIMDEDGTTALELAALAGHDHVVYCLLSEYQCPGVNSALMMACIGGHTSMIRTLICDHKADVNAMDKKNRAPVHLAADCGRDEVVQTLVEFGCDTEVKGLYGRSLFHWACKGGSVNLVRTLIRKHNADAEARDDENNTPLHVAACFAKEEVVLTLIEEFNCDTEVKGQVGKSLLHSACEGGSANLVRTLIREYNADVNTRDDENNTPLHVAAFRGKEEVVLTLINEFGCNTKVKGRYGRSLLHSACEGGSINLVRTLIHEHNADINACDDYNVTPLHHAAELGKHEVVEVLKTEFGCEH